MSFINVICGMDLLMNLVSIPQIGSLSQCEIVIIKALCVYSSLCYNHGTFGRQPKFCVSIAAIDLPADNLQTDAKYFSKI